MADGNFPVDEVVEAVKKEVKDHYEKLDKKTNDLSSVIDGLKKGTYDKDTLDGHLKEIRSEVEKLSKTADELDKKLARPDRGGPNERKSPGQVVAESDAWKKLAEQKSGRTGKIELKAITSPGMEVDGGNVNPLAARQRVPGIITPPEQPLMVRDLIPVATTTSSSIEFVSETGFTNNAAPVAENALKPESGVTYGLENVPVRTIAHWIQASRQVLDDVPQLRGLIDGRLRYGLKYKEELQLLLGDGTGQNLLGLVPQATAYVNTGNPGSNIVDKVRWAKLQVRKSFYPATAVVLNPEDWAKMELLKDADGNYLYSAFASGTEPRLWGMRVVESDGIPAGDFMVGAFSLAAQIWDRQQASVEVSTEDRDNFVKNMVTILAEERLALAVYRPESFVYGDL